MSDDCEKYLKMLKSELSADRRLAKQLINNKIDEGNRECLEWVLDSLKKTPSKGLYRFVKWLDRKLNPK